MGQSSIPVRRQEPRDTTSTLGIVTSSSTSHSSMDKTLLQRLALPFGVSLISFLAFTSQWLFYYIEPAPLRKGDAYVFNVLVACQIICFYLTCLTDPGVIPQDWHERFDADRSVADDSQASQRQRWCRKCETFKPPRAHHCKTCKRSVSQRYAALRTSPDNPIAA